MDLKFLPYKIFAMQLSLFIFRFIFNFLLVILFGPLQNYDLLLTYLVFPFLKMNSHLVCLPILTINLPLFTLNFILPFF